MSKFEGQLIQSSRTDWEGFYVKVENNLYWLCHQHHGTNDMLSHCVPVTKAFYDAFVEEKKKKEVV